MAYTEQADIDILAYGDYSVNDDVENTDLNDMLDAFKALSDNIVAIIGADSTPSETVNNLAVSVAAVAPHDPSIMRTIISNNGADSDHDLDFTAGYEIDSTGTYRMGGSAWTKKMDTAWAAGDDGGGLFNGALGNTTWYAIYKIRKDSDGSIDYGCDTVSAGVANLPSGYSIYRRIGYFYTDGSANIYPFIQRGNRFEWTGTPPAVYSTNNPGVNQVTPVVACPPLEIAILTIRSNTSTASMHNLLVGNASLTVAPSTTNRTMGINNGYGSVNMHILVNASSQIGYEYDASDANLYINIFNVGWIDTGI